MCWIKSLTPIRIIGQACGANTLGLDAGIFANSRFDGTTGGIQSLPVLTPSPADVATTSTVSAFYTGARLTYHLPRDVMLPDEVLEARFFYTRDGSRLAVPSDSTLRLDIEKIVDRTGKLVLRDQYGDYISVEPDPTTLTDVGATTLLQAAKKLGTITLRPELSLRATDGSVVKVP